MKQTIIDGSLHGKIIPCILVLALVFLGVIGLVLPIIPGLLLLAIAALVAARHFPSVDALLRKHRAVEEHLKTAHRARHLNLAAKVQLAGWLCMKMFVDGATLVASLVAKLRAPAR